MPSANPHGGARGLGTRTTAFIRGHRLWTLLIAALAIASVTIGVLSVGPWPIHSLIHGSYGFSTDIEIDSHGNLHVVLPMGRLYYATNAHGGWSISVLDDVYEVWDAALAKDSNDRIHVAYAAVLREGGVIVGTPSIRYVLLDGGGLRLREVIDTDGRYPAIAVDSMDRVRVTYVTWKLGALKHATRVGGAWVNTTADTRYPVAIYSAIAVDSKGAAHVTFTGFSESEIGYATNEGGNWTSESLATNGAPNPRVPIAVDKSDRVHVTYFRCLDSCERKSIFHAVRELGHWAQTAVASGVTNEGNPLITLDLALGPNGQPHVLFSDRATGALFYASPAEENWITRIVDRGTLSVLGGSLALGGDGRIAIAYYRVDEGRIDTGTSARVALSDLRYDNLVDFLWGISLYLTAEAVAFATAGFILWRRTRRSELSGRVVRG